MVSFKKLAETVTKLRAEKGYTQEKLGNLTGISRIIIDRIEQILKMMSALRQQIMLRRKFELAEQISYEED